MNDDDMLRARQMLAEVAHNDGEELTPEDSAVFASSRENVDTETDGDEGGQTENRELKVKPFTVHADTQLRAEPR